ncbi:MAG TPA: dephospho-CoA kinase [Bacteroidia bacterium]|jgi:dephospho-CoA kinase|nr:dephospho-CoA kinase [Bacteroidia bacterium]
MLYEGIPMGKVGVTGGIGSGKSTVCRLFKCLEIPVFNADEAGRRLLAEDADVIKQVKHIFGETVIINGKPDRKKIGGIVFNNPEKLAQLNAVIHPAVRKSYIDWSSEQKSAYAIYEAAILFETGIYKQLDYTILVVAPEALRVKRVMQRDGIDEATVKARISNQWSDEEKKKLADFVLINDDSIPLLPQVMEIHNKLISQAK